VSDRPACEYLAWDSDFFGLRIARAVAPLGPDSIGDVRAWCTAEKIDGVYALLPCADRTGIATAEASGFGLVDVRVTLVADRGATAVTDRPDIRPARDGDRASLRAIARASHHDSRFYQDGHFPRARCDALYETWIDQSCGGSADAVFVAVRDTEPVGYITCERLPERAGRIGLFAVRASDHGRGLGRALVQRSLDWFGRAGTERVVVTTQARNVAALRLYERCGFVTESVDLWYHWWRADR